eukprot:scaffold11898_cov69-Cyclotella_meneghiniana.AAC.8
MGVSTAEGGEGRRCGSGPVMVSPAAMVARGERRINYVCKRAQRCGNNYIVNLCQYLVHNKNTKGKVKQ